MHGNDRTTPTATEFRRRRLSFRQSVALFSGALLAGTRGHVVALHQGLRRVPEDVEKLIKACWQGPPSALVRRVEVSDGDPKMLDLRPSGEKFGMLPTA